MTLRVFKTSSQSDQNFTICNNGVLVYDVPKLSMTTLRGGERQYAPIHWDFPKLAINKNFSILQSVHVNGWERNRKKFKPVRRPNLQVFLHTDLVERSFHVNQKLFRVFYHMPCLNDFEDYL